METADRAARSRSWRGTARAVAVVLATLLVIGVVGLAAFPWGVLKGRLEKRLSDRIGKPVTIGGMTREDMFSFHPTLLLTDVRVPQPARVPGNLGLGDLAVVGSAHARISVPALLFGGPVLQTLDISKARFNLYRSADGWESWSGRGKSGSDRGSALRTLIVSDTRLRYHDERQKRGFTASVAVDAKGLRMRGNGQIHGYPIMLAASGGAILDHPADTRWPFSVRIEGEAVGFSLVGTMAAPLDARHLRGKANGHAIDLALLDAIVEAGLPETQPVKIVADVERDGADWKVVSLTGTVGRSDVAGNAVILKREGRTRIDGAIRSARFDFDDLSSNQGRQIAAAKRRRFGDRLIPDTAIDLSSVARTDGHLTLRADRLLWANDSPFQSLHAELDLDRSRLVLAPLRVGLKQGTMSGRLVVDQRQGGPQLDLDLRLANARLIHFVPDTGTDGNLVGRIRLKGPGATVRQAVGRSTGTVAMVATGGTLPARTASLLGQDVVKGLTVDKDKQAVLRCLIVRLDVARGTARPNPLLIDTSRAQTRAAGSIDLASERLALDLKGLPKTQAFLRLQGSVLVRGTIKAPDVQVPREATSAKGVLKMIGRALGGKERDLAADADCAALSRAALRR